MIETRRSVLAAAFALAMIAGAAGGASVDPSLYSGMRWRLLGPFRGGRTVAAAGVPGHPNVFYFGAVGGGVWKTTNAGRTWNAVFEGQPNASIGAIAVAPSNPSVLYAGTGEADMRSDVSVGNGVFASSDAGATWEARGLADTQQIGRILVDPADSSRVFVAALGHPYGPNAERGVYRSTDGGRTWGKVLFRDENTGAIDLSFDPSNSRVIYAALWATRRPPWNVYPPSNGPGGGLFRSTDGGDSWAEMRGVGFPQGAVGRIGIAPAPSDPRRLYAIVDAEKGGLYRSDDGGSSWTLVCEDRRISQRGWYFGGVTVDPSSRDRVYVANTALYVSDDGGKKFSVFKGAPGGDDYHQLWIDPSEPARMITASDQGAVVSVDAGATWSSWYNQPTAQFYHAAVDARFPFRVYGAQQDSGAAGTLSRGDIGSISPRDWTPICAGGENGYIAIDPRDPDLLFGGSVERCDMRTKQAQDVSPTIGRPGLFRHTWTLPLAFSPADRTSLYFGNQFLFRTTDRGMSWAQISEDLTREDPGVPPNLDPATAADSPVAGSRRGVIYAIAPSPLDSKLMWIGTDDGRVEVSRDGARAWSDVTPRELTAWSKVTMIEASRFDAATAYAAVDRHRLDDFEPYIYRTRDGGAHWQRITAGLPAGAWVNAIREDPVRGGLLYAGTETGIAVSFDAGDHWQSLQLNLPHASVRDIAFSESDLIVGTHGRALWVLDDLAPLRQFDAATSTVPAFLFRPAAAVRVRAGADWGTPLPKDEPTGENPPEGAIIDYVLGPGEAGSVVLEILDASGGIVRRYSSAEPEPPKDPNNLEFSPWWVSIAPGLSTSAGMHRMTWDFRYEFPGPRDSEEESPFRDSGGPWALPGNYRVRLTAAGRELEQPLTLLADPRVKTPAEDLREQFALASKVAADLKRASETTAQIGRIDTELAAGASGASGDQELSGRLRRCRDDMQAIAGDRLPSRFASLGLPPPPTNPAWLSMIREDLRHLLNSVESADAAPTADSRGAFADADRRLTDALARWRHLREGEISDLRRRLARRSS